MDIPELESQPAMRGAACAQRGDAADSGGWPGRERRWLRPGTRAQSQAGEKTATPLGQGLGTGDAHIAFSGCPSPTVASFGA